MKAFTPTDRLLEEILCEQKHTNRLLRRLLRDEESNFPAGFSIQQSGENMVPLDPGQSPQFTATPTPAGSSLGSVIPTWTSSDPTNAPVTVDPTGLIATVALAAAIIVGESVTLSISAVSADGTQTAAGTFTFTVGAPPPPPPAFPTGFSIAQTA